LVGRRGERDASLSCRALGSDAPAPHGRAAPDGWFGSAARPDLLRKQLRSASPAAQSACCRQHAVGHKTFVDYSGKLVPITDPVTGAVSTAEIFVAVVGASSPTYAEAIWTQTLPDWDWRHVRMFRL
jgi:hypothetical protein